MNVPAYLGIWLIAAAFTVLLLVLLLCYERWEDRRWEKRR